MSTFHSMVRKQLPRTREINHDFLADYLARTGEYDEDERVADDEATLGRLLSRSLDAACPQTHSLDCAIRVGAPQHSALPALAVQHFVQFTLVYVLCLAMNAVHPALALKVECGCIAAVFALAAIGALAADDTTLFFHKVTEAFSLLAFVGIVLIASPSGVVEWVVTIVMTLALTTMLAFPFTVTGAELIACGIRLFWIVLLVYALPRTGAILTLAPHHAATLFIAANFIACLPIPAAIQHWHAAHRYAVLEDVRNFGPSAPLYQGNLREAFAGLLAYLGATSAAVFCGAIFVRFGVPLYSTTAQWQPDFCPLTRLLGAVEATAFLNFALFQIVAQNRMPSIARFLASYYSTWRALTAWLSDNPPLSYPTIFQFVRPWSNRSLRLAVVAVALAANTAFVVNWLTIWSAQAYQTTFPPADKMDKWTDPTAPAEPEILEAPRFGTQYWVSLFAAAMFLPPAMVLLMLHTAWGPSFQAFSDHFETFDEQALPPLLAVSLTASLRKYFGAVVLATTLLWN